MNKGGFKSYTIWRSAGCGLMSCLVPLGYSCILSVNIIYQGNTVFGCGTKCELNLDFETIDWKND